MSPSAGRFISEDPFAGDLASPISQHRFTYASLSPSNSSDPTGADDISSVALSFSVMALGQLATTAPPRVSTQQARQLERQRMQQSVNNVIAAVNASGWLKRPSGCGDWASEVSSGIRLASPRYHKWLILAGWHYLYHIATAVWETGKHWYDPGTEMWDAWTATTPATGRGSLHFYPRPSTMRP
jgi:hypothetical protein